MELMLSRGVCVCLESALNEPWNELILMIYGVYIT